MKTLVQKYGSYGSHSRATTEPTPNPAGTTQSAMKSSHDSLGQGSRQNWARLSCTVLPEACTHHWSDEKSRCESAPPRSSRFSATATACSVSTTAPWRGYGSIRSSWLWKWAMRSSPATAAASSCHRVHHEWQHYVALVQRKPRARRDGAQ